MENYYNLLNAIEELGIDVSKHREDIAVPRKSFFRYEFEEFKIDFLPVIKGLKNFMTSFNGKEIVSLYEVDIPIISYIDLLKTKETDSRDKDIDDIEHLKRKQ
ncbi:MAG: hypothetical protein KAS71_12825 [Bacteroidales bacterium]|nr:hypothetical protein [Bacteroidales bacterium]